MLPSLLALDFASPGRLWLLVVAAGLAVAYVVTQVRRRRDAAKFASPALLPLLVPGKAPWWRHAVALVFAGGADQLRAVYADINADVTAVPIDRSVAVWFSTAALALLLAASLTSMLRTGGVVWA